MLLVVDDGDVRMYSVSFGIYLRISADHSRSARMRELCDMSIGNEGVSAWQKVLTKV